MKQHLPTAVSLVLANMIGTGVFAALGFQLMDFRSGPSILILWTIGGLIALCGAIAYADLARLLPRSGGEYHFLGTLYHPSLGLMAGLLSAIVGFGVPTAITALILGGYANRAFPFLPANAVAVAVIVLGTLAHGVSPRTSGRVQVFSTALKLVLIVGLIVAASILPGHGDVRWDFVPSEHLADILSPAFPVALYWVFYSYSGWNAAVYGLEEWHKPDRTVKLALVGGTLLVILLYMGLNTAFLAAAPLDHLRGQKEIAHIAAAALLGQETGKWVSGLLALGLFASVSALLWAGPRVLVAMGKDLRALSFFSKGSGERPWRPLIFQAGLAIALVFAGDVQFLLNYTQTGLTLCTLLTVVGLIVLKRKGLPVNASSTAAAWIFVAFTGFVIVRMFFVEPLPAACGIATAAACAALWKTLRRLSS